MNSADGVSSGMEFDDVILRIGRELSEGTLLVVDRGFGELLEASVGMQALLGASTLPDMCVSVLCVCR
jgi:hypothetical protein